MPDDPKATPIAKHKDADQDDGTVPFHQFEETLVADPCAESQGHLATPASERRKSIPEEFGRYRIKRLLGKGAMGAVYLARDTQLDRDVAIKVPYFSEERPDVIARFYREARAMATLHHPNLCPIHDVGENDGTHYLTMAFIDGQSLQEVMASGGPPGQQQIVRLIQKTAIALHAAHEANVVHRDLKPDNIMIDKRNEPIIMDFGLAQRHIENEVHLTHSGALLGSPAYMSPEQVKGDQKQIGRRTDVYSLGVIMYRMLCGRLPFEGSVATVLGKIAMQPPPPPREFNPHVNSQLEAICLKALAKNLNDRYQTAQEMADDLSQFLDDGPYLHGNASPVVCDSEAMARSRGSRRVLIASAVVVGLLAITTVAFKILTADHLAQESLQATQNGISAVTPDTSRQQMPEQVSLFGPRRIVSTKLEDLGFCCAADFDADGAIDLASAAFNGCQIAWHKNDGRGGFTTHVLSTPGYAISVEAVDMDDDGDADLLAAAYGDDSVMWYQNDGQGNFAEHVITDAMDGARFASAADLDRDGDIDVVAAGGRDSSLVWFENDGSESFSAHFLSEVLGPRSIVIADLTGDNLLDIICSCSDDNSVLCFVNSTTGQFTPHVVTKEAQGARGLHVADLDRDGDIDVLSSSEDDSKITWHENRFPGSFVHHVISNTAYSARDVHAADLDDDGDIDVLTASFADDTIAWFENDGMQNFSRHVVSTKADGAYCVFAADIDGDNILDVVAGSASDNTLSWFKNLRAP